VAIHEFTASKFSVCYWRKQRYPVLQLPTNIGKHFHGQRVENSLNLKILEYVMGVHNNDEGETTKLNSVA
jgi:hypothetical protein